MSLEITESEMISRFVDSLKKSASRAEEITKVEDNKKPKIFIDFINGLKISAGSAHQLAHAQQNPGFLNIRDTLEGIIEVGQRLPTFYNSQNIIWLKIKESLTELAQRGEKLATSKAVARTDVLAMLDVRQKKASEDLANENG